MAPRRRGRAGRGERRARRAARVLRRRRRQQQPAATCCSTSCSIGELPARAGPAARPAPIVAGAARAPRRSPNHAQWATFLRNHDEVDLSRLTDRRARRGASRRSGPSRTCSSTAAASAAGSRRCSAATGAGCELAYSLQFTLPGTPVIRYGEEIGMGDDLSLPERDAIRTPMQWADAAERRLLHRRPSSSGRSIGGRRLRLPDGQRGRRSAATRTRCSPGSSG